MDLLDLVFPKTCLNCNKSGKYFCEDCVSKVHILNRFDPATKTFSVFAYDGIIQKGIIKLKYKFAFDLGKELADLTVENFKHSFPQKCVLLPIPLHKSRENWRGFNQSEIVGKLLSEKLNWGFDNNILTRTSQGKTQVGLKSIERVRNIRGKFAVNDEALRAILSAVEGSDPTFIVFDDVATTGSTIQEAIRILKKSGAQKVFGLTIAR
ncbi:MAG TPA: ComF family protein [Patescibacteria group bacterium]|nr:ComF family protein [Patescibacteria group bacterium]